MKQKTATNSVHGISNTVKKKLSIVICMKYVYAMCYLVCSTTSRIWGFGKNVALKQMASKNNFKAAIEVLNKLPSTVMKHDIICAGEMAMAATCNWTDILNSLRQNVLQNKYLQVTKYFKQNLYH